MKIRSQLLTLLVAVVAPVAVLAGLASVALWTLQRDAFEQRFLERVSALRLALDTELDSAIRVLRTAAQAPGMTDPERWPIVRARLAELIANHPAWTTIALRDAAGAVPLRVDRGPTPPNLQLDERSAAQALATREVHISNLVESGNGDGQRFVTWIAMPLLREQRVEGVIYLGIASEHWLGFLRGYPVSERATLALNDRDGRIIARTLNHETWVGQQSLASYWDRTRGKTEGAFRNVGLDGQSFYTAFSRSRHAGWVVGTGVPQDEVEAALAGTTRAIAAAVIVAGALALFLAWLFGSRISAAMTALAAHARKVGDGEAPPAQAAPRMAIDEAETVRRALDSSAERLRARERALADALARESRARANAERQSSTKDEFLAMLGHELRNPLSAMKTAVALLARPGSAPDVEQRARGIVERQIRHLTDILDDLLDVARLNAGKVVLNKRLLDVTDVARHVADSFRDAGRCTHLELSCELAPVSVFADETRLEQVLANLLDNACKYTPAGGRVRIEVRPDGDRSALISVGDSGSGIAAELLPRLFDVFSQGRRTLDRAQGGLGLGLAVVRRLVELHGGTVEAHSEGADCGALFTVRLPRASDVHAADAAPAFEAGAAVPRRVTVVEDNPDTRTSMQALLTAQGHVVTVAADGPDGVAAITHSGCEVALVDIGLPGFDGYEVARRVRAAQPAAGPWVLMIALTGYGAAEDRALALAAGFDAFLVKPFDLARFHAVLTDASLA